MSCQTNKGSGPHKSLRLGRSPACLGEGSQAAIFYPSPSTDPSRRRARAAPRRAPGGEPTLRSTLRAGGAPRASPPPAQPGPPTTHTPAHSRGAEPGLRLAPASPLPSPSPQFRRPRAGTAPGEESRSRRLSEQPAAANTPPLRRE